MKNLNKIIPCGGCGNDPTKRCIGCGHDFYKKYKIKVLAREIKFKAKNKKSDWIFGMPTYDFIYIFNDDQYDSVDNYEIISDTLCQYSGMKDKYGVEIYEGDIINCIEADKMIGNTTHNNCIVIFDKGTFFYCPSMNINQPHSLLYNAYMAEVIGNIHD